MKLWSRRKLLIIALLSVLGTAAFWRLQDGVKQSTSAASSAARSDLPNGPVRASNSSGVSALPTERESRRARSQGDIDLRSRTTSGIGLFNESARSLMQSNVLAKIDYGRHRTFVECRSLAFYGDGVAAIRANMLPIAAKTDNSWLHYGDAADETRLKGFSRSVERCEKLFGAARYSSEEMVASSALPGVAQVEAIRATLRAANDFEDPKTKAVLAHAVSEPLFSAVGSLLLNKLDYSELAKSYGENGAISLQNLVYELVLCRMGDDCDRGGIVTEQLCWASAICGDRVEDAIYANLRSRGLDTTALNQFVTRVHQALLLGDTSIFRKQKPKK